jgi:hypothetical protein
MKAMHGVMLALAILGACSKKDERAKITADDMKGVDEKATATDPAPAGYVSTTGRYSVGKVFGTLEEKDMTDPQGVVWPSASWSTKKSMYSSQYADFASPEAALAEMKAFKMTNDPSEMTRDEEKTFQGRPGREMVMKTGSGMEVTIRFIVDGSRVYKAMGGTKVEQENVTAFIDSMKVDGEAAPAAAAATGAESDNLKAGREVVAIFKEATALGVSTKGDCAAFDAGIDPIRGKLWDLGKAHPGVFKDLSDAELKSIGAANAMDEVSGHLMACKDSVHAKEFAFAIGKVLEATPEEKAAALTPAPAAEPASTAVAKPVEEKPAAKKKAAAPKPAPKKGADGVPDDFY